MTLYSREIALVTRPSGMPPREAFEERLVEVTKPGPGEVRVRNKFMSIDPWMLRAMREAIPADSGPGASKFGPAVLGATLHGSALGEVIDSEDDRFQPGDLVLSLEAWREAFTIEGSALEKVDPGPFDPMHYLGAAGLTGLVSYAGIDILDIKEGDILFVSAAAGAVGSMACQIGKMRGATVIGSAGGQEKAAYLNEIGCTHAIDYKAERDMAAALQRVAPEGITAFFDNVGSSHLTAAIETARPHARMLLAGFIATMDGTVDASFPDMTRVVRQRYRIDGFSAGDHFAKIPRLRKDVAKWIDEGILLPRVTIFEGIERAPEALVSMMSGGNIGKMMVKLG